MEHFFQKYKKPLIVGGGLIVASWVLVALLIYSLFTKQQEQFDKRRNDFYERSVKVKNERNKRHKEFSNAMDNMMASTSKSFQESDQRYKESRARDAIDSEHSKR
jgi:biopolymer transport protein ExbB/TolQ